MASASLKIFRQHPCRYLGSLHQARGNASIASSKLYQPNLIILAPSFGRRKFAKFFHATHIRSIGQANRPYVDPKYSYAFGRSPGHLIYSTIDKELRRQIALTPDSLAFASFMENKKATFKDLDHDVNKLAKSLVKDINIRKGDRVGVFAYNCYNWIVVQFACMRIGATLCPINPSYKPSELAHILEAAQVRCLFLPGPRSVQASLNNHIEVLHSNEIVDQSKAGELALENVIFMDSDTDYDIEPKLAGCKFHNWSDTQNDGLVFQSDQEAEEAGVGYPNDVCVIDPDDVSTDDLYGIYYTSGTTGKPKGACVSQFNVINIVQFAQKRLRQGLPDNWKSITSTTLPLFHIYAGVLNALSPLVSNSCLILAGHKYDIKSFVECIIQNNVNTITVTPTILIDLLTHVESNNLKDLPLRVVQTGGAALPPEVVSKAHKILPNLEQILSGYGSTENGAVATIQTLHEPPTLKSRTVGSPIDFTEVRIAKPGSDVVLPHGEIGEVQTRGFNTMVEYLGQPDKTAEVLTKKRWYKTGDMGLMYPHGSIEISGRIKHMIIKGGENIYPEEVRGLIHKLDYVEDCHVVGVPDKRFGEQVCAWVKLKPGFSEAKDADKRVPGKEIHKDDIINYCKDKITYFKVPKYVIFVEEFPMTSTKKAQNNVMSELSIKILGLNDKE